MKSNIEIIKDYLRGDRPVSIFGYTGEVSKYKKDGEKWIDAKGIEWQKKDGKTIQLTKTQGDIVREAIGKSLCKNCKMDVKWGNKYDRLFFIKTGMCYDCLIEYETRLRALGLFSIYEKYKMLSNESGFLKDTKDKLNDVINYFNKDDGTIEVLCNSDGFVERFRGADKDKILKDTKQDLKLVRKRLKCVITMKNEAKKEFKEKALDAKVKIYV